jgi:nicotinamide-nucleotide amidase
MSERTDDATAAASREPGGAGLGSRGVGSRELAAQIVGLLGARHQTVAVAESLTGGLLGAAITAIPGASVVFRGGIIAYATELKAALLGVPSEMLACYGPVHPDVAAAMATGARDRLGATIGVATTGVAGPDPADGKPPGTVHIAVTAGQVPVTRALALDGGRDEVRRGTVEQALRLLWSVIWEEGH